MARDAAKVRIGNIWFTIKFEIVVLTGGPLYFVLADGSEYTYTFENGRLVLDGHYYEVDGFTEVSRVLGAFEE